MLRSRILWGWLFALAASALPALWATASQIERNPLGKFVDARTGAWTAEVYWQFFHWWLPMATAVSVLAFACLFLDRRSR